jgi:hypothetical protein
MERGHPVRLSAKREQAAERRPDAAERAAHAGGQGCPRFISTPGTHLAAEPDLQILE